MFFNTLFFKEVLFSPLEQFEIFTVFLFLTNNMIFLSIIVIILCSFWYKVAVVDTIFLVKNNYKALNYLFQEQILLLTARNIGNAGQYYYPLLTVLFVFILIINLIGLIPYAFTLTSHIITTFALSFTFFIGTNILALMNKKWEYFGLFLPSGAPIAIVPFLIVIELISYFARVFSLAIRLFANMMAGHSLLKILIGFVYTIFMYDVIGLILGWFPFLLVFVITFLEVGVALIQAYVFTILMCVYIKDFYSAH